MFSYCSSKTQAAEPSELLLQAQPGQENVLTRQDTLHAHGIRTQADGSVPGEGTPEAWAGQLSLC